MTDFIPLADLLPREIGPYMTLMALGFVVAATGHLLRVKLMIAAGIMMVFLATVAFPLAINLSQETPTQVQDFARQQR